MSELLFLSHRIPYPPDKGDKIRSYHLLKALASRHTVHVGTFVDDERDWQHVDALRGICGDSCIRPLDPRRAKLKSAKGLLTGDALTMAYYADGELRRWVRDLAARRSLAGVFAFSSSMGQFGADVPLRPSGVRVIDFCDVDSDKWNQYAASHGFPLRQVYRREARLLARDEAHLMRSFDVSLVISDTEAKVLRDAVGEGAGHVEVVPNGVDADYFDPARRYDDPFQPRQRPIVFTGAMDYHANVDGVVWFAREVFPTVRAQNPDALFAIVGSNPAPEVRALESEPGVIVTGRVPDVRPYLAHAAAVVAPLRIARGVQNKVLEAMAMDRPVVATRNALQGIPGAENAGVQSVDTPGGIAAALQSLIASGDEAGGLAREFVTRHFSWGAATERLQTLFAAGAHE